MDKERLSADRHGSRSQQHGQRDSGLGTGEGRLACPRKRSGQVPRHVVRFVASEGGATPPVETSRGGCSIVFADMTMSEIALILLNCGRLAG